MSELYDILKQGLEDAINHNVTEWVQVRHGHWIYTPTEPLGYVCSECGKSSCGFTYCPNCGAKMDEIEERLIMPKADGSTIPKDYVDEVTE